jgi:hypothetical protein
MDVFLLARIHMAGPPDNDRPFAKGLTPVFGVIDTRDVPNVKFRINVNTTAAQAAI